MSARAYWIALAVGAALFGYQQWLIRNREREFCFKAFLNNNGFGFVIFVGVVANYLLAVNS